MVRFESDYLEGALPEVLAAIEEINYDQTPGYGNDKYCDAVAGGLVVIDFLYRRQTSGSAPSR